MASPIPYIREFDPKYGKLVRISANVRRLTAQNPSPFSGWGTNVYIIGQNAVDLIDPGPDTDAHFDTLIKVLGDEKVRRIFVTHHHLDHSPMANRLAVHFGCQTYGYGRPKTPLTPAGVQMEAGDDDAFTPAIKVQDGEIFEGDGWSLEAIHTPGHTSNHMCYAVQEDNGLICGDHIMAWATSVISPPDGDMKDYLASLHKVLDRRFSTLWPGHGAAITAPTPFIEAYIAHRHARNAQILEQLAQGQSQIKAMVPIMYADVDPGLYPAACHSVLAHMIHMVKTGAVQCDGVPKLESRYRLP
ncbi:MAG: MBL fold metallo-hydrolase [Robiginitomaculum sp.]|nr:MBL fold metallo-hydrolase [Robiginitomaculum sp.]MDQ7076923.1 MBL fold metallo-hydrolase [Robiginitomaculum sp.]